VCGATPVLGEVAAACSRGGHIWLSRHVRSLIVAVPVAPSSSVTVRVTTLVRLGCRRCTIGFWAARGVATTEVPEVGRDRCHRGRWSLRAIEVDRQRCLARGHIRIRDGATGGWLALAVTVTVLGVGLRPAQ
jgi:hypothetical protein